MNAVVLTGGTNKRFGSDKSKALINGQPLLKILIDNLDCDKLIIVGEKSEFEGEYIQEEPAKSGPVAAIAAALTLVESDLVAIFATDMPFAPKLIAKLQQALVKDAALPLDSSGVAQPLAAIYRVAALRSAIKSYDTLIDQSMKSLIAKLEVNLVPVVETELLIDIDTPEELKRAIDLASRLAQ